MKKADGAAIKQKNAIATGQVPELSKKEKEAFKANFKVAKKIKQKQARNQTVANLQIVTPVDELKNSRVV